MSIDGLVSGLSTSDLIQQLMQIEQQPQLRLQQRVSSLNTVVSAMQALNTKIDALRTAAQDLAGTSSWNVMKATASDDSVVAATAGSTATSGSLSFTVSQLATAAAQVSSSTVASTGTIVASGPISITKGGVTTAIDVGDGSLASVVDAINRSTTGVKAAAVQVATGQYRLQLTSSTTGAASTFSVSGLGAALGTMNTLTTAQDAVLTVGTIGSGGYTISSASNTVSDVLPGVTLSLKKTGAVSVDVASDSGALADKVQKLVDAANAALSDIKTKTAYNGDKQTGGPLLGNSLVTSLTGSILEAVVGTTGAAATAGISLTRDGTVSFDRTKFLAAYAANPTGVADSFRQTASSTSGSLAFVSATDSTQAGSYTVNVTTAATQGSVTGTAIAVNQKTETIDVRVGSTQVTYNVAANATAAQIVAGLNAAFAGSSLGLVAEVSGSSVKIRTASYGSAQSFDVRTSAVGNRQTGLATVANTWETHKGTDVAGTFTLSNGTVVTGTGIGQMLGVPTGTTGVTGLTVQVTGAATGTIGTINYGPGLAQQLSTLALGVSKSDTGSLSLAIKGQQDTISSLNDQIDAWNPRLAIKQEALQRQFTALETALNQMKSQSSWLAGQVNALSNG
jgi:flagellar hook-associated protein 2